MSLDWAKLAEPFPDHEVKQRPGRGSLTFSYVDARAVAQRLDDVLTPAGWDFTCTTIPGTDVVKGTLRIGDNVREDHGYPNSEKDEEPIKAATSDALKRCAVLFGVGRHLYEDNKPGQRPAARPTPIRQAPSRSSTAMPEAPEFPDDFGQDEGYLNPVPPTPVKAPPFAAIGAPQPNKGEGCPDHPGEVWRGEPGDLYHRMPDGNGYCRPEGQPKKARAR